MLFYACSKNQTVETNEAYSFYNLRQFGWKSKSITHTISDIQYKATLVPIQYYIAKSVGIDSVQQIDSIYKSLKDERVIEVEFQHKNEDDLLKDQYTKRAYDDAVKYMSFQMQNDFEIVIQSGDTISCSGVTFERNFKVAPFKRILLHFGNVPEEENVSLVYKDELFDNGLMKFNFKETPIKL